jgi:hypothetical protein
LGRPAWDDVKLYRQNGMSCTDIDLPIRPDLAARMALRPDVDWKAANEDFNEIEAEVREPKPKDPTAAERQRRRRAKIRDGNRDSVTVTNGHTLPLLDYQEELAG